MGKEKFNKSLKYSQIFCDCFCLTVLVLFIIKYFPIEVLSNEPASGGDTGSHFWPLYVLVKYSLPEFHIRTLNPGNLCGEPHFLHYFPLPFLIMALFAKFMAIGTSFNIGTLLPLVLLPLSIFFFIKSLDVKFPAPILGAAFSNFFLFNEAYSILGGNTLSLLAGQFSHLYAIVFFLFASGFLLREIKYDKSPLLSSIFFSSVAMSHGYILLGVPFIALSIVLFYKHKTLNYRLKKVAITGTFSFLLSAWFLIPSVNNIKWNTPFIMKWIFRNGYHDFIGKILVPFSIVTLISFILILLILLLGFRPKPFKNLLQSSLILLVPTISYAFYYFIFPKIGLVDARAIPQIILFLTILGSIYISSIISLSGRFITTLLTIPIILFSTYWTEQNISKLDSWLKWNYSSWSTKKLYPSVQAISKELNSDFSAPRVVYEHNQKNNEAGTPRVFEMLPYFANRGTLESLYTQATILAPMSYNIQALVSKSPSCPLTGYKCPHWNLKKSISKLKLMGANELILMTKEIKKEADQLTKIKNPPLKKGKTFTPWTLYKLTEEVNLVDTLTKPPVIISKKDWKKSFAIWFENYTPKSNFLIIKDLTPKEVLKNIKNKSSSLWNGKNCKPKLKVDFGKIELDTNCPKVVHILKFSYNDSWGTNNKTKLFPISPGFIALIPNSEHITLNFGDSLLWEISNIISWFSLFILVVFSVAHRQES